MTQKEFINHWHKERPLNKEAVLKIFAKKKKLLIQNVLDYVKNHYKEWKKLSNEEQTKVISELFGDFEKQYKSYIEKGVKKAIAVGNARLKTFKKENLI